MQDDLRGRMNYGSSGSGERPAPPAEGPDNTDNENLDQRVDENHTITTSSRAPHLLAAQNKPHHRFMAWYRGLSGNQKFATVGTVVVLVGIITATAVWMTHHAPPVKSAVVPVVKKQQSPVATTVPNTLTGRLVDPAVNKRQVTGVMIENSVFARPQSGLDQAGVVFEAIAEGGITRFMALFQDTQPDYLGPVRSARPYFLQWCMGFDCALAHVGGSPEALQDIKDWHVKNLDQFAGASYFHRVSNRPAPHNMYTSATSLSQYEDKQGYNSSSFTGFARLNPDPSKRPKINQSATPAKSINFDYPGTSYDVHYDYDAASNTYLRSEGGQPHTVVNAAGKTVRLAPNVVVALVMSYGLESDNHHSQYGTMGSGAAYFFQDGTITKGTWSKTTAQSQFEFKTDSGTTMQLEPGQTWVSVLGSPSDVSYQ